MLGSDLHISSIAQLPQDERAAALALLTDEEIEQLLHDWHFFARTEQLPPAGDWQFWVFLAGRGAGKTKAGSEWTRGKIKNGFGRLHLIAPTTRDARDVMIEGDSGILNSSWASDRDRFGNMIGRPVYEPSKRKLTWENGAIATAFSAEEPDRLRGPQCDSMWCDEVAAWNNGDPDEAWDMALFGLRLGENPQGLVTTTPRPIPLLRELLRNKNTVKTHSHTEANRANLAPTFLANIVDKYEGTRLGRQELAGELIEEAEGALWTRNLIEKCRTDVTPDLPRIVVSIDPPASHSATSALCGIICAGRGTDQRGYVLGDYSGRMSPNEWGTMAVNVFDAWKADAIVIETNQGGDMAEHVIRTVRHNAPVIRVHASKGKQARAEPVASLYERGKISHVGPYPELEDQMCTWEPLSGLPSPDRLDALVWAFDSLMITGRQRQLMFG
jgi:phage terminase large subunit-like protein